MIETTEIRKDPYPILPLSRRVTHYCEIGNLDLDFLINSEADASELLENQE